MCRQSWTGSRRSRTCMSCGGSSFPISRVSGKQTNNNSSDVVWTTIYRVESFPLFARPLFLSGKSISRVSAVGSYHYLIDWLDIPEGIHSGPDREFHFWGLIHYSLYVAGPSQQRVTVSIDYINKLPWCAVGYIFHIVFDGGTLIKKKRGPLKTQLDNYFNDVIKISARMLQGRMNILYYLPSNKGNSSSSFLWKVFFYTDQQLIGSNGLVHVLFLYRHSRIAIVLSHSL